MERQGWLVIAITVLVAMAGCAGFASDGEETPAATSTPTATATATGTSTPTATAPSPGSEATYPAGWTESGVENTSLALESHYRAVLTGPSATVTYRSSVIESGGLQPRNTTLDMGVDTADQQVYASIEGEASHREVFFGDGTLSRWDARNETLLGQSNARFLRVAQSIDNRVLHSQLLLYELELERTVRRQGTTALVYNVTGTYSNTMSQTYGAARDATGQVVVATNGRVLEIETTVTYAKGTFRYRYTQGRLGETDVGRPAWLPA